MATPEMLDLSLFGTSVSRITDEVVTHIPLTDFFHLPEPGERSMRFHAVWLPREPYDDGGGPALAAYRYGLCPFAKL